MVNVFEQQNLLYLLFLLQEQTKMLAGIPSESTVYIKWAADHT